MIAHLTLHRRLRWLGSSVLRMFTILSWDRHPEVEGDDICCCCSWKVRNNMMETARSSTHFWTDEQTQFMLNQLKELNILKFMDGRKTRNGELFKKVARKMEEAGFPRTPEQVRIRWKNVCQTRQWHKWSRSYVVPILRPLRRTPWEPTTGPSRTPRH